MARVLVAGGGGFIGGHLARRLKEQGHEVRSVDIKPVEDWFLADPDIESLSADLSLRDECTRAVEGVERVYNLAADMGGMGFIENNKALCMLSVLVNTHLLQASRDSVLDRFFFSSSACVYAADKQTDPDVTALAESDAYPALPEDGYGWEKLFSERMCRHFREDFAVPTRIARFHNVYGPHGTYSGGREKAPAAVCRKVIEAIQSGSLTINIWGDGNQTRSFMFIDDCLKGIDMITSGDFAEPINLGSSEMVSINDLVTIVEKIAGVTLERTYDLSAPQGVRGRNSDNRLIEATFGWQPNTPLVTGMEETYKWIYDQMTPH